MKGNFDACFALVLQEEGHYVNDPRDPGGRTNLGVTQRAWEAYARQEVTEDFMRKLTPDQVKPFYKVMYWDKIKGDELPVGIDYAVFDFAVNSGVSRASKFLQTAVRVASDGVIGPKTIAAVKAVDPLETVDAICDMRLDFLKKLDNFDHFGKGWTSRVGRVNDKAASMVKDA